jgi:hypothetical protein
MGLFQKRPTVCPVPLPMRTSVGLWAGPIGPVSTWAMPDRYADSSPNFWHARMGLVVASVEAYSP